MSQDSPLVVNDLILAWFDNLNGRSETHLMALKFMENSVSVSSCIDVTTSDLCARGHVPATDIEYDEDHTNWTTAAKPSSLNYRPVSNLSFISKILEKVVAARLLSHMESNSMSNKLQSAYKKFHSTESALLKVENDVLLNMEKGRVTTLTLLDLSAAFDTIDHLTLISLLSWMEFLVQLLTGLHRT